MSITFPEQVEIPVEEEEIQEGAAGLKPSEVIRLAVQVWGERGLTTGKMRDFHTGAVCAVGAIRTALGVDLNLNVECGVAHDGCASVGHTVPRSNTLYWNTVEALADHLDYGRYGEQFMGFLNDPAERRIVIWNDNLSPLAHAQRMKALVRVAEALETKGM